MFTDKTESEIRKDERKSIRNCCFNFPRFKKFSINQQAKTIIAIECSILNNSVDNARDRNIQAYWNDLQFLEQYSSIAYNIKINLDVESSVNIKKDSRIGCYLINQVCDYMLVGFLSEEYRKYFTAKLQKNTANKNFTLFDFPTETFNMIMSYVQNIDPRSLGNLTSLELNPYINQAIIDELILREQQKVEVKYSKMHTCSHCKSKKTKMREIQTRSGDEGGTLFITCIECQHTWRQY